MALITWSTAVEMSEDIEAQQEILFEALRLNQERTGKPWEGKLIQNPRTKEFRCEIRKQVLGNNMLIVVGDTAHDIHWRGHEYGDSDIRLSSNGRMYFNEDQFSEMIVAIKEARLVLEHAQSKETSTRAKL